MSTPNNSEEIDIIQFFAAIGNMFRNFFASIGKFFKAAFFLFIDFLLYLKKNYIYLGIGLIIGFILSFVISKNSTTYYGKALLRTNYGAQANLNEKIDLLNGLIKDKDTIQLSKILNLKPSNAAQLTLFKVEPVINDIYLLEDYEEYLMTKDTTVYKFIEYNDYKSNFKKYEELNNYWELTIKAKRPSAFQHLNENFINLFNKEDVLIERKKNYLEALQLHKLKILKSLKDIDSMRQIYNHVMIELAKNKSNAATNIVVTSDKVRGPEAPYNLFQERKNLLEDLEVLSNKINKYNDVLVVINPIPNNGIQEPTLVQNMHLRYALYGFLLAIVLLWLRDFNTFLTKYEQLKAKRS
ncbi:MAG TPA: hypothetical protein ENK64_03690 [Flavobacteriales bacterium]|nr:hypothetical protein [Flavobacteriales bacterium]